MFVATDDLQFHHARAERWDNILSLVATLDDADRWLTSQEIADRTKMRMRFVRDLAAEQTGTWVCRRETAQGAYEFATTGGWVVDGFASDRLHADPECPHLKDFDHRPASDQELGQVDRCPDCSGGSQPHDPVSIDGWGINPEAEVSADD